MLRRLGVFFVTFVIAVLANVAVVWVWPDSDVNWYRSAVLGVVVALSVTIVDARAARGSD